MQHYFVDRKMEHFPQCLLLSRLNHFIAIYTARNPNLSQYIKSSIETSIERQTSSQTA
ncbi:Uncharacterised protein [Klebsiella pneumoniae subsp. ozaenae]|uniref:Uncharacterized protein n=1 Tax=Klebsiella pneumoniae subsp. ozaenae TaxID=574 RepID=A0A377Z069_KLEPO|nr:Uncharacterised protein [Klebsiella pneumoniae subsp. ozaenae]VFS19960.1 Uncharacterised protein [Serratia liquefaciens]